MHDILTCNKGKLNLSNKYSKLTLFFNTYTLIFASKPSLKNSLNLKIPIFVSSRNFFWSLFQFEQLPPKNHHHQQNQESQLGKCYHIPARNEGEKNLMAMLISRNLLRAFFLSWAFSCARVQASFSLCTWFSIKKKKM